MDINSTIKLNNGTKIPIFGLGTWKTPNGKVCENAVSWALEAGYRHIDTAAIYGNEESVGRAMANSKVKRKDIFLTTKLWNDDQNKAEAAFNDSLKRLGTDYVDLYLIHFPVTAIRIKAWKSLESIYKSGKCKSIGVSNFMIPHLKELLNAADIVPAVNQVEFNAYLNQHELFDFCKSNGIGIEAYSPLTHGNKMEDAKLQNMAAKYKKTAAQVLIRWALQKGMIVIPKSTHKDRIVENASVFDFQIKSIDMNEMERWDENLRLCWDPTVVP
jgi:diketogulonate reductase-like aldo/keto reductase